MASLDQVLDLNNTSFDDIIGRLKAYEERILEEEESQEDQSKLMYTNMESQTPQSNCDYNRDFQSIGRRGRFYYGGQGR